MSPNLEDPFFLDFVVKSLNHGEKTIFCFENRNFGQKSICL